MEFTNEIERGCGIDVHKAIVVATINGKGLKKQTREFSAYTSSLTSLRKWLIDNRVTHAAIESTGVYWKPVFNIIGEDVKLILVNARHIKNVPGRKTDIKDSEWICKLLLSGLLKASFIPPKDIRDLRDLTRYQTKLTQQIAAEKNRIIRELEDANIKLSTVLQDVSGATGTKIINAIIEGETNPEKLIRFYHGKIKVGREEFKEALNGKLTEHHRFMLRQMKQHIVSIEKQIEEIENEIDRRVAPYEKDIELLREIPGVDRKGAIGIISETGTDMSVFKDEHHLASWAGLSPGNNESAGKKKSGRTTHGDKYLKALVVELAWGATRTKGTFYRAKYNSIVGRRGKKRALIAVGHKILCATYHILNEKVSYKEVGIEYFEKRKQKNRLERLKRELKEFGYKVIKNDLEAA
jgi:transposase